MSDFYTGEIRMFAGYYAPHQWAFCNGTLLTVAEQSALYSLIGTFYGGDGRTNFALPDLRGRVPMHFGQGPGLNNRIIGEKSGLEQVVLTEAQLPAHTHQLQASTGNATTPNPTGAVLAKVEGEFYATDTSGTETMMVGEVQPSGGFPDGSTDPHTNMAPYQGINFIIALSGLYPPRN